MKKTTSTLALMAALAALTVLPAEAMGQACLANSARSGQGHVAGSALFTDGAWGPGATVGYNVPGPLSVQGDFQHVRFRNSDVTQNAIGAQAALEMAGLPVSLCPTATVGYRWQSDAEEFGDFSADGAMFAGGLSLGHTVRSPGLGITPHLAAGVVHDRTKYSVEEFSVTDSETYGSFSGGLLLSTGSVFGGPSVSLTTIEGSDPVFSVGLGFTFGPALR